MSVTLCVGGGKSLRYLVISSRVDFSSALVRHPMPQDALKDGDIFG